MKVGDLIKWNKYLGIVIDARIKADHPPMAPMVRIAWMDGGATTLFRDEIEVISECR